MKKTKIDISLNDFPKELHKLMIGRNIYEKRRVKTNIRGTVSTRL